MLQVALALVAPAAGKRDLAGVAAKVVPALGEDEAGTVGPAVERHEHGGVDAAGGIHLGRLVERQERLRQGVAGGSTALR